jgi:hypothetical protein
LPEALLEWRKSCEAWSTNVAAAARGKLLTVDCGTPVNTTPRASYAIMGSKAKIEVASASEREVVMSAGASARGAASTSFPEATANWAKACDATRALGVELLGDRLLGTGCGEPKNLTPSASYALVASSAPVVAVSAGNTKIVVEGFALGAPSTSHPEAYAAFTTASVDALRAAVRRAGSERVEGFEVAEPKNLTPNASYAIFGATTKLLLGVDVPEGGLAPITSIARVNGPSTSSTTEAAAGWVRACETAADKEKTDHGPRFVAAACDEPTIAGSRVESDLTIWLLP